MMYFTYDQWKQFISVETNLQSKVMFEILKENNVQLIAPGHNISKEIISMFEVNYVLKHEFKDGNKKTVVVEQEFRTEDSLKNMNFDIIDGNQQKLF